MKAPKKTKPAELPESNPFVDGFTLQPGMSALALDGTVTVTSVPEPGSYAMFAAGLGLMGLIARRRRFS